MATFKNAIDLFPEYHGDSSFCCSDSKIVYNCAHTVSMALDKSGFSIKKTHSTINARCKNKFPIRARDVKEWVIANTAATAHKDFPPPGKYAFFFTWKNETYG